MRFARALAGMLLLAIGVPALVVGGALWVVARHVDVDDRFHARIEPVTTSGHAVIVPDLADLLRRDVPFVRAGANRIGLSARTADGPAFLGLAPAAEVDRWLGSAPRATLTRIAVARGGLPTRMESTGGPAPVEPAPSPLGQPFWTHEGIGTLEWSPAELGDQPVSLVVMRPDGRADLALDVRADLRVGWLTPARWALPVAGVLLVALALLLLLRAPRPREVVFVVEPDQVPVLARRLGVTSLSALGSSTGTRPTPGAASESRSRVDSERTLVAVGSGSRPTTLADLPGGATRPAGSTPRRPNTPPGLAWPSLRLDHPGATGGPGGRGGDGA